MREIQLFNTGSLFLRFPFLFDFYLNICEEVVHKNLVSLDYFLKQTILRDENSIDRSNEKRMLTSGKSYVNYLLHVDSF